MKLSVNECKEKIYDADMVLVGLGKEFEPKLLDVIAYNPIYKRYKDEIDSLGEQESAWCEYAIYFHELSSNSNPIITPILENINKLSGLLEGKNVFFVSTCMLDIVRFSNINSERIVTPCGTIFKMECHVGCRKDVFDSTEALTKLYKKLASFGNDDVFDKQYIMQFIPFCNKCEATMEINQITGVSYSEEGYIERWEYYQKWLSGTVNKKLVLLELNVSFDTPTVIRWPFEKINMINNKSLLIRVNEKLAMLTPEIADSATAFSMSGSEFINELVQ